MLQVKKEIRLDGITIPYVLKRHPRSKRISLTLLDDGRLIVTIPRRGTHLGAERFIREKRSWIQKYINVDKLRSHDEQRDTYEKEYKTRKQEVLELVEQKVSYFNTNYRFSYNKIYVKNHKAQWGSCTEKKNLNFNYRLIHLPKDLQNYLIVHELCHLRELNHSQKFWELISLTFKNYKILRRRLKEASIYPTNTHIKYYGAVKQLTLL